MIAVNKTNDSISVKGHAGYAEVGKDIVCAAVSILTTTLIQSVEDLTEDTIDYKIEAGNTSIKFLSLSDKTKCLIDSFLIGLKMLADYYPENVKIIYKEQKYE